jgi:hypothetical protein
MKAMRYLLPLLFAALIGWSSCEKTSPAEALITVTDSTGKRIPGAVVVLRQDSVVNPTTGAQAVINESKLSDAAGQALFTFKLEAVLNVEVDKGTLSARDYIRLEQSKQVTKTIIIR